MKNSVFLLIGGNQGDRFKLLSQAKIEIQKEIGKIEQESSIYKTEAWGFESENDFLNQVVIITSNLTPVQVLKKCQSIENKLGRVRQSKEYSSRTMDIDILFYNDEIIENSELIVPHEKLHLRKFTLEPLVELAPNFIHPVIKKNLSIILQDCADKTDVKKL